MVSAHQLWRFYFVLAIAVAFCGCGPVNSPPAVSPTKQTEKSADAISKELLQKSIKNLNDFLADYSTGYSPDVVRSNNSQALFECQSIARLDTDIGEALDVLTRVHHECRGRSLMEQESNQGNGSALVSNAARIVINLITNKTAARHREFLKWRQGDPVDPPIDPVQQFYEEKDTIRDATYLSRQLHEKFITGDFTREDSRAFDKLHMPRFRRNDPRPPAIALPKLIPNEPGD